MLWLPIAPVELSFRILSTYCATKGNCCLEFSDKYQLTVKFAKELPGLCCATNGFLMVPLMH